MKKIFAGVVILCSMFFIEARGADGIRYIEPESLTVSLNKTTNLIFHYKIKQVDVGSADVLAKLCNDTVLLVKAARADFPSSNLSVYTADGKLHAFTVGYAATPEHLYLRVEDGTGDSRKRDGQAAAVIDGPEKKETHREAGASETADIHHESVMSAEVTADVMEANCRKVMAGAYQGHCLRHRHGSVWLRLYHLRTQGDLFYFPLELKNCSSIAYETLQLRCFIRDKQHVRRMASQEQEVKPLEIAGDATYILGQSPRRLVVVLPRFTLPDGKFLRIAITEKEGGRDLRIDVGSRVLEKAKVI